MKDWNMIHKVKALYDDGNGLSIQKIVKQLGVSRNTVRKYLRMTPEEIQQRQESADRQKRLDIHKIYITHLLVTFPELSAQKVIQKLEQKVGKLPVSARSVRRYVEALRKLVPVAQERYYEPVLDDMPGVQCQIDPGELRGLRVGDEVLTLYFVVFVLSFSRLMYVALCFRPINTQSFIQMHDEAFRYFGGIPEECVYDQTKMVVISEEFREVDANRQLLEYATVVGYRIHACEGYDPESKGKVESGVKYVKGNCLYGEEFKDRDDLVSHTKDWLNETANVRVHGTTGRSPLEYYELEEKAYMRPYLSPERLLNKSSGSLDPRQADKTGLISWKGNKYSVPLLYQRARIGVKEDELSVHIFDLSTGDLITTHSLCKEKGRIIKKALHYKDHKAHIEGLESEIGEIIDSKSAKRLCALLKKTNPRIYKDQLAGARTLLKQHVPIADEDLEHILGRDVLSASRLRDFLEAIKGRMKPDTIDEPLDSIAPELKCYGDLTVGQMEVANG